MDWSRYTHIIEHIEVDAGILRNVPSWIAAKGYKRVLVVSDVNTQRAAGDALCAMLADAGISYELFCYPDPSLTADEAAIGALTAAFDTGHELFAAVGSGTIGDLCKYVSRKVGRPFIAVGTAPSMDGYASSGAAMTLGGMKTTPQMHSPLAIFCDTDILKDAPMPMLAAGLGDILGKLNALADWELSRLLTGEPMPRDIAGMVSDAVDACTAAADAAKEREAAAVRKMTEALILSGLAMTLYGDSRPASGAEHHLAHYWEMRILAAGKEPAAHGLKVGAAALCALRLWKALPAEPSLPVAQDRERILALVREKYGLSAPALLKTENPNLSYEHIMARWPDILDIARRLPEPEEVEALLSKLGAPVRLPEIGVSGPLLKESILLARERKKTYSILQLLGDLGLLESAGDALARQLERRALEQVKLFVLDLDGTLYLEDEVFPYSEQFLKDIKASGRDYVFFTNNSSKNKEAYLQKLARMNLPVTPDKFLMSTEVILDFLKTERPGKRVWAAGTPDMLAQFRAAGIDPQSENPDIAVLGFDRTLTYDKLLTLHRALENGAELLGVHMDYVCPVPGGTIPDCGALMSIFRSIWHLEPEFFGKPSRRALDYIIRTTGVSEESLCFVGDRLYTDIAITASTKAVSVLVLSGETRLEDAERAAEACPDMIVDDVSGILGSVRTVTEDKEGCYAGS